MKEEKDYSTINPIEAAIDIIKANPEAVGAGHWNESDYEFFRQYWTKQVEEMPPVDQMEWPRNPAPNEIEWHDASSLISIHYRDDADTLACKLAQLDERTHNTLGLTLKAINLKNQRCEDGRMLSEVDQILVTVDGVSEKLYRLGPEQSDGTVPFGPEESK